jgi:hypothetical protein
MSDHIRVEGAEAVALLEESRLPNPFLNANEQSVVHIAGKTYRWHRETKGGQLTLLPGYREAQSA